MFLSLCALAVAATSTTAHGEVLFRLDAGGLYDSNLSGARGDDVRADHAATFAASAGWLLAPSAADSLALNVDFRHEAYARYHGLDVVAVGGSAIYGHKFGLGLVAPRLSVSVSATNENYRTDIRDRNRVVLSAALSKRFNETFDAAVGVFNDLSYSKNDLPVVPDISGKVFDLRGHGGYASAGYAITERVLLAAKVAPRRDDIVAT
jgi:hypothetical protein